MYVGHKREATTLRYVKCSAQEGYQAVVKADEDDMISVIGKRNLKNRTIITK